MKVGFIGLGNMGGAMASNLLKAGHELTIFNRSAAKAAALIESGANKADSIAAACAADVVFTMLADDKAVETVVMGEGGVLGALPKGAVHVSSSTISYALSERLDQAHADVGQRYLAAPVFGRPDAAAAGKLFFVIAGEPSAQVTCKPLLDAMGQRVFSISQSAADANLVKLSGNFLLCSVVEALGEAMALTSKAGIDRHAYLDLLTATLFGAPVYKTYGALIADQEFSPAKFALVLGLKDIDLAQQAAGDLGVPMPLASLIHDRLQRLVNQGGDGLDLSALGGLSFLDAGLGSKEQTAHPT